MSTPYRVDPGAMKVIAVLLGDPNPLHFDHDLVASSGLGDRLILQGPVTAAIAYEAVRAATGRAIRTADLTFRGTAVEADVLDCDVRLEDGDSAVVVVTNADGATIADGRVTLEPITAPEEHR